MKCPKCGQEMPEGMRFCTSCGVELKKKSGVLWKIGLACLLVAVLIGAGIWAVSALRDQNDVRLSEKVHQTAPENQPTEAPTEAPTEPPTEAPTEPEKPDYAVYPDQLSFIMEGNENLYYYVMGEGPYQYDITEEGDIITGTNPYYWTFIAYETALEAKIQEYVALLEEEPYNLELIYTKDMGDEWVYVYRYNGEHDVYPLNISGFIPEDAGEYHLAVDVSARNTSGVSISVEVAAGYGLEPVDPVTEQEILDGKGYVRTSNATENFEGVDPNQTYRCYYCKTPVTPEEGTVYSSEQIIYCDNCYAEMFATEPTE